MTMPRTRLGRSLVALVALPIAVATATGTAGASAPPTLPPGYVVLEDDTGLLTVAVPDTWTDIDTAPGSTADGPVPWISASPDLESFESTFDVPGMRYVAVPFTADPSSLTVDFGLPDGACTDLEVVPYDDGHVHRCHADRHVMRYGRVGVVGARRRQPRR